MPLNFNNNNYFENNKNLLDKFSITHKFEIKIVSRNE